MTDFEDPATFDDSYYTSLPTNDKKRFEEDFNDNLDHFDESEVRRTLKTEYNNEKEHLDLIKAAGACFHTKGRPANISGFEFYGVNPLCDVRETPADIVLINSEHNCVYFVFVLCEIGGEDRQQWIENVNKARQFFAKEDTKEILRDRMNANQREIDLSYVTATREVDTMGMEFPILNKKCDANDYSVWEFDLDYKWVQCTNGSFSHPDLEEIFGTRTDYSKQKEPIDFAVGTHVVFPLKKVIYKTLTQNSIFKSENVDEFPQSAFFDHYDNELAVFSSLNSDDSVSEQEVERVLTSADNARIVTSEESEIEDGDYKVIYSGARGPDHARDAVETRYFKYMPRYEVGRKAFEKTKDEFDESTNLDDFG